MVNLVGGSVGGLLAVVVVGVVTSFVLDVGDVTVITVDVVVDHLAASVGKEFVKAYGAVGDIVETVGRRAILDEALPGRDHHLLGQARQATEVVIVQNAAEAGLSCLAIDAVVRAAMWVHHNAPVPGQRRRLDLMLAHLDRMTPSRLIFQAEI